MNRADVVHAVTGYFLVEKTHTKLQENLPVCAVSPGDTESSPSVAPNALCDVEICKHVVLTRFLKSLPYSQPLSQVVNDFLA